MARTSTSRLQLGGKMVKAATSAIHPYYMRAKDWILLEPVAKRAAPYLPSYRTAYGVSLATAIVAMLLTFLYVAGQTGAHEANPITASIIEMIGWEGLLLIKAGVIIFDARILFPFAVSKGRAHWDGCSPEAAALWLWLGAFVNSLDAIWDLWITRNLSAPSLTISPTGFILALLAVIVAGFVFVPSKHATQYAEGY